ncbi:MAG: hypothetical protein AAF570_13405, partial [Bacteroidota bacterium]
VPDGNYEIYYDPVNSFCYDPDTFALEIRDHYVNFDYSTPNLCLCNGPVLPQGVWPIQGPPSYFPLGNFFFESTSSGSLALDPITGEIDPANSNAGTYFVGFAVLDPPCRDTVYANSTIVIGAALDASFNIQVNDPDTVCDNAAQFTISPQQNLPGTWTVSGGGTLSTNILGSNLEVFPTNSDAGTYVITRTLNGSCPCVATDSLTIFESDDATFSYDSTLAASATFCTSAITAAPYLATPSPGYFHSLDTNIVVISVNGSVDLANSVAGTYTVRHVTTGVCPDIKTTQIVIQEVLDADFILPDTTGNFCQNLAAIDIAPINPSAPTSWTYTSASQDSLTLTTMGDTLRIFPRSGDQGTFTITRTITDNCPSSVSKAITILDTTNAAFSYDSTFLPTASFCENMTTAAAYRQDPAPGYFYALDSLIDLDSINGSVDLANSAPNTSAYTVHHVTTGLCPDTSTTEIVIQEVLDPNFSLPDSSGNFCQSLDTLSLIPNNPTAPTIWSYTSTGQDSLVMSPDTNNTLKIVPENGTTGTFIITRLINNACPDSASRFITILDTANATFTYANAFGDPTPEFCTNEGDAAPLLEGGVQGIFSVQDTNVTINPATGTVVLDASNSGTHTISHVVGGACPDSASTTINVFDAPNAFFEYPKDALCATEGTLALSSTANSPGSFRSVPQNVVVQNSGLLQNLDTLGGVTIVVTHSFSTGACDDKYTDSVRVWAYDSTTQINLLDTFHCNTVAFDVPVVGASDWDW